MDDDEAQEDLGSLVAVFASPVASWLLDFARHTGFRTAPIELRPDVDESGVLGHADAVDNFCSRSQKRGLAQER